MGGTILYIDDDEDFRFMIKRLLDSDGYNVLLASDIDEATHRCGFDCPDLILLDLCLHGCDALESLPRLKSVYPKAPVVIYTAFGGFKDDFRTWAAEAFVEKSAQFDVLKETVERTLAGR